MRRACTALLALSPLMTLGACYRTEPARETRVIIQQPQPSYQQTVTLAPAAPPPARSELVPPPPPGVGQVVWQPGHWTYTGIPGSEWTWQPGQYTPPPVGQTTWVPGHWTQQPSGGWFWIDGHWA